MLVPMIEIAADGGLRSLEGASQLGESDEAFLAHQIENTLTALLY